ncbi:MAG: hypothetical protein HKN85_08790 [Gammaproteobacteria bacterium]|nr:hypothetical protein [Gammaproteobacteria bacterium]
MTEKPQIIAVLEDAELAHRAGDFVNALKFYEYFFDHALDDDPYALYGVRLSHCLEGWAELAGVYPGAKKGLENKQRDSLKQFIEDKNPERYHDYLSICRILGQEAAALEQFLALHSEQPATAAKLVKYVWDDLVGLECWAVCSELLSAPNLKLEELFSIFDESARLKDLDPAFNKISFEQHIVDSLLNDVQNVVMVLRNAGRLEDIQALQRQFHQAVDNRDHSLLLKQVHAKSSFLFAGH